MRLDSFLYVNEFCSSRTLAARLISEGMVEVDGKIAVKPSEQIDENARIRILENSLTRYVGRGGLKLEKALNSFGVEVFGKVAIDIGSSTGGFTDCLLQRGIQKVYAIDSGSDQLHESLRGNSRIVIFENTNARYIDANIIPEKADIIVMDVSFISQSLLYESVLRFLKDDGVFISLIKPQFEAGKKYLTKKGIVTDKKVHKKIIEELKVAAELVGLKMQSVTDSPIEGGDGNTEYLALFKRILN